MNRQFVDSMWPHALRVSQRTGLDPRLVVAQSALETGWGRAAPGNNYFGIKSHGKPGGQTFATHEVVNGQRVNINDSFRAYDGMGQSADGYADFLERNPRYRGLLSADGLDNQIAALAASGYATDPNYGQKVRSVAQSISPGRSDPQAQGIAGDTTRALGRTPEQPIVSTQGGANMQPRGLLSDGAPQGQPRPQQQQPEKQRKWYSDPALMEALALGFNSMRLNPDPNMAGMISQSRDRRAQTKEEQQAEAKRAEINNEAARYLDQLGTPQAKQAMELLQRGLVGGQEALKMGLAPPDQPDMTSAMKEYGLARQQGFEGSLQDWLDRGEDQDPTTTAVRTLQQRAAAAGLEPGTEAYREFMIQGGADKGMSLEVGADGSVRFGTGGQSPKALTEGQSKDTVYATRAEGALPILDQYEQELAQLGERALDADPTGIVRGRLQSPEYQMAQQAGNEFLQAILRKDTGAAITEGEQLLYGRAYLPQPGDGPEVIAQKRQSRRRALEAIKAGLPPSAIVQQEMALRNSGGGGEQSAPSAGQQGQTANQPPAILSEQDRELWEFMTEEERRQILNSYEGQQ